MGVDRDAAALHRETHAVRGGMNENAVVHLGIHERERKGRKQAPVRESGEARLLHGAIRRASANTSTAA